jgi:hypothetical protein
MSVVMASKALAAASSQPVCELNEKEAEIWSDAFVNFMDQFEVVPDPRVMAAINLGLATIAIVTPRAAIIAANSKSNRATRAGSGSTVRPPTDPNAEQVNVVQLRPEASPIPDAPAEGAPMSAHEIAAMIALDALQPQGGGNL